MNDKNLLTNDEIVDFINKYERLIKRKASYYQKFPILNIDFEEAYSIAIEAIIIASKKFDKDRGYDFCTYAIPCIENKFKMMIRKRNNQVKYISKELSLDELIPGKSNRSNSDMDVYDYIEDEYLLPIEDRVINSILLNEGIEKIKKYKNVYESLEMYSNGYTHTEIANKFGVNQSTITRKINKAQKILKELL